MVFKCALVSLLVVTFVGLLRSYLIAMGFICKFARSVFLRAVSWRWWARISQLPSTRCLTFIWKKSDFCGKRWLADFFPSSGSSLTVIGRLGLCFPLFGIGSALEVNGTSYLCEVLHLLEMWPFLLVGSPTLEFSRGVFGRVKVWGVFPSSFSVGTLLLQL